MTRIALWTLAALAVLILAAFLWLRQSPYWAGITLFSENHRVENFRAMERVFPARDVPRAGAVWAFDRAPAPLPETYAFEGEPHNLAAFFDRTETTGLLVVHRGAITHEEYRQGADETSPFTSWSMAKSVLSALIGIAVEEGHIASLRDPIGAYVPALAGSAYGDVPIEDALTMSSGVAFDEDYDNPASDINMLFIRAMAMGVPVEETLAGLDRVRDSGIYNDYVSSDSMALGLVLEAATGMAPADYLASRLWGPMGAESCSPLRRSASTSSSQPREIIAATAFFAAAPCSPSGSGMARLPGRVAARLRTMVWVSVSLGMGASGSGGAAGNAPPSTG